MQVVMALICVVAQPAGGQSNESPRAAAIDSAIRPLVDSGFTGVVLVAHNGRVVLHRPYRSPRIKLDTSNVFWIGSITKEFTAGAVLRLASENRLRLTDSISQFIPFAPADKRKITIRQLLTHTSGIDANFAGSELLDRDSAVKSILARPLYASPGTQYRYGDDDYRLLAAIVEIVSGTTWEEAIRRLLLQPAGLNRTGFWSGRPDWGHKGANGMSSTTGDLLRWTKVLRAGTVLTAREVRALQGPQFLVRYSGHEAVYYGFGTRVYQLGGRTIEVFHSGSSDDGHTAAVRVLATGTTLIVLSNAGNHAGTTWSSYVAQHLPVRSRMVMSVIRGKPR